MKRILAVFLALCAVLACVSFAGCSKGNEGGPSQNGNEAQPTAENGGNEADGTTDFVRIDVKDYGSIVVELYPDVAPITVENFKKLVGEGFYNGLIFHRVIPGFMIQGGDPTGTGTGGPGWTIKGEFAHNGVRNDLKHIRGVLSMARSMAADSAGSQFFIMHKDAPHLDGSYAAFGKVVEGIEAVDRIAGTETDFSDRPLHDMRMVRVTFAEKA